MKNDFNRKRWLWTTTGIKLGQRHSYFNNGVTFKKLMHVYNKFANMPENSVVMFLNEENIVTRLYTVNEVKRILKLNQL
jgi:hypothetical protein